MTPSVDARRGATLLEVIVALAILGAVGGSAAVLAADAGRLLRGAGRRDEELRAANAFLDKVALWPREDLDRRLGDHPQGPWEVAIARPWPTLYTVELRDSAGGPPLLATALFRPMPLAPVSPDAPR